MKLPVTAIRPFPVFALAFSLAVSALAGGGSTAVPTIVSIEANSITVKTGRHAGLKSTAYDPGVKVPGASNLETYRTTTTSITVNGLKATLADLKPGMRVDVTQGLDRATAATIAAATIAAASVARRFAV